METGKGGIPMLKSNPDTRYLHQVKKYLAVQNKDSRMLVDGLKMELAEFANANPHAAYEAFVEVFGAPDIAARELMENAMIAVDSKTIRQRRIAARLVIAALIFLLFGLTCELVSVLSHQEVAVTETIYYDGEPVDLPDSKMIGEVH